jgi:tetratricopeptide (TPR) repeat protein
LELQEDSFEMEVYETLGKCCMKLGQYKEALTCYKMQLSFSWYLNRPVEELKAYDNIGMAYFYMQDLQKANNYHQRAMKGLIEASDSVSKEITRQQKVNMDRLRVLELTKDNLTIYYMMISGVGMNKQILDFRNAALTGMFRINKKENEYDFLVSDTLDTLAKYTSLPSPASHNINR